MIEGRDVSNSCRIHLTEALRDQVHIGCCIYTGSVIISGVATEPTYVLSDFWALIVVELELSKRRTSEIYRKYGIFISRRVPNLSDIRSPSLLEAGWRDHMAVKL